MLEATTTIANHLGRIFSISLINTYHLSLQPFVAACGTALAPFCIECHAFFAGLSGGAKLWWVRLK